MTTTSLQETSRPTTRHPAGSGITLTALAAGYVMAVLDTTVINVAGPSISTQLGIGLDALTWAVDGYTLTFASLLLLAGSLADRLGAKRVYLAGLALFVLASLACGLAPTGTVLVAARLVQGVAAALFLPSSLSLLTASFTESRQRARMLGLWASIVSIAAGLGPVVGGTLVDTLGWRSIFLVNVPIGLVGLVLAQRVLVAQPAKRVRVTVLGHLLAVLALAALCFAVIEGPAYGWLSAPILGAAVAAVLLGAACVATQRRSPNPIIPPDLVRNRAFTAANGVGFLINFACFGGIYLLGLLLQKAWGARPFDAGLRLLPVMGVFVLGNLLFTRIVGRTGTRLPILVGLPVAGLGALGLTCISPGLPYWVLVVVLAVVHLGVGVAVPAVVAALVEAAGPTHGNVAGATLNANRQAGTLVGVALAGTLLNAAGWYRGAALDFAVMGACYLLAATLTWRFIRT